MEVRYKLTLELSKIKKYEYLEAHRGDKNSRFIDCTLTANDVIVPLTTGMTATFDAVTENVIVADGMSATVDTTTNEIIIPLSEEMLSVPGLMKIDLKVSEGDSLITAQTIGVKVGDSAINNNSKFDSAGGTIEQLLKNKIDNADGAVKLANLAQEILDYIVSNGGGSGGGTSGITATQLAETLKSYVTTTTHTAELATKEDIVNRVKSFTQDFTDELGAKYPTVLALLKHLEDYYYDFSDIDGAFDGIRIDDNGDLIIALPDGEEKNLGSVKGDAGADGKDGADYVLTDEDKSEIATTVKADLSQLEPLFANSVEECTDTTKVYVLPDGYIYAYIDEQWTNTEHAFTSFDSLNKVITACCDTETVAGGNYNLFKINEVEFSTRLQDDVEGAVSSTVINAVTGWIPVEYGKYYSFTMAVDGVRLNYLSGTGTFIALVRMNIQRKDGTIVVYNRDSDEMNATLCGTYNTRSITIPIEDVVAVRIHFQTPSTAYDISSAEKLGAYEPMIVEGDTAEEAFQNSINFDYLDGGDEVPSEVEYTLKHDDSKADKTETEELRNHLIGSMDISADGATVGTIVAKDLAISTGTAVNSASTHGITTDYIPCTKGNTITVDSSDYTFQVMEYLEKNTPEVYSGVLEYGTTYTVTQNGYVRICIRYVDTTLIADSYLLKHIVANLTGYYDFGEFAKKASDSTSSPYYRNVNFGVIPFSYYQGVGTDYENEGFGKDTQYETFITEWKSLVANHSGYVTETELGTASDGQKIYLYDFKPVRIPNQNKPIPKIIITAGQHGWEKCNVFGWYYFANDLLNNWNKHPALNYLRNHVELMIIPVVNTYGFDNFTYKNANEVNINRNYDSNWVLLEDTTSQQYGGAKPFDQPESQIVRDLILSNEDALLVVDSHTCSSTSAESYDIMTYCGVCQSTDNYYNRMLDVAAHQLSAISANFNIDYELNQPDTIMGYLNMNAGNGILRNWATDNGYIGVLTEGFTGFPNRTAYTGEVYKANEEFVVNYLITALNYLSK